METEKELLETLQNWQVHKIKIAQLEADLEEKCYGVTTSYSDACSFSSGTVSSKLENYAFSVIEIKNEIREIKDKMKLCINAFNKAELSKLEKLAVQYTCTGKSLLQLSKDFNLAQARIYRIRDRAVRKMYIEIRNGAKY